MTNWEYKTVVVGNNLILEKKLNELGNDGWEVCGVKSYDFSHSETQVVLKRPKPTYQLGPR